MMMKNNKVQKNHKNNVKDIKHEEKMITYPYAIIWLIREKRKGQESGRRKSDNLIDKKDISHI